jgi:hypothetical protein
MFIANTHDEPLTAMPIAGVTAPAPGSGATPPPAHNGTAYFTVTNARNGFSKTYAR